MTSVSGSVGEDRGFVLGWAALAEGVGSIGVGDSVVGDGLADAVGSDPVSVGDAVAVAPGVGVAGLAAQAARKRQTATACKGDTKGLLFNMPN